MSFSLWNEEQEKPVQHLRVVDLTVLLPGPLLTRLLAQYGADVVKVEHLPVGDPLRDVKNTALSELVNQGKRSVALDLKTSQGAALVRQMAGEADIFVESFREGVMDSLGLGYAELSEENPDLLYVSLRGLGGEKAVHAGHDLNFIASSGVGEWFLENGPHYSTQFGDMVGGCYLPAIQLLFHLANPARRGMHLVSTMDQSFRALYLPRAFDAFKGEERQPQDPGSFGAHQALDGRYPHSRFYQCRDKQWISLNAIQTKHWELFCEVVDRSEWKPKMWDEALVADVEKLFEGAPASYWEALTAKREVCLFRVVPWQEHLGQPTTRSHLATDPLSWAGFLPNSELKPVPQLGQDTTAVLTSMGITQDQIQEWEKQGILKTGAEPAKE